MGFLNDGFSYGIEFLAQDYNEEVLLKVAAGFEEVNGNEANLSSLTPSLYTVSDNVTKLITKYEETLEYNSKTYDSWLDDVRTFFLEYNTYEDKDARALELLNNYPQENVALEFIKPDFKVHYVVLFIVLFIVVLYVYKKMKIFCKNVRRLLKKKKRRK
jgi:predicted PurR-regulated permease PerM